MLVFLYSLVLSKNKTKKIIICTSIQIQNHRAPYLKLNRRAKSAIPLSLLIFFSLVSFGGIPLPSIQYIRQHYFFFVQGLQKTSKLQYNKKKQYWLINMGVKLLGAKAIVPGEPDSLCKRTLLWSRRRQNFFFFSVASCCVVELTVGRGRMGSCQFC